MTAALAIAAAAEPAPAARPAYRELRFDEDWSVLADPSALPSHDLFDPLKYVELGDAVWVSFGGQLRGRIESWNDYDFHSDRVFGLGRILAHADFHFGERVRFFIEGKSASSTDPGVFDDTRKGDVDWLDLQNGFLELSGEGLRFRLGRQELGFGRQRLVSPLDWANARRTFDGLTLEWLGEDWHTTGFANRPVKVRADDWNSYQDIEAFYGLHATRRAEGTQPRLDLYAYGIEEKDGDGRFFTLGSRLAGPIPDTQLDYDLEVAGQLGSDSFEALMVATQLGWWLSEQRLSPRFFVGFDWASGSDDGDVFNQLFPLGHAYFGAIDVIGRSNILAPSVGVTLRPLPAVTTELVVYQFWLDDPGAGLYAADGHLVRSGSASDRHGVGAEIDLVGKWQVDPHTALFAGYAHFFPGSFVRETGPDGATDFVYGMVQYTF